MVMLPSFFDGAMRWLQVSKDDLPSCPFFMNV